MPTAAVEDYLKAIYHLQGGTENESATVTEIAVQMEVAPASASAMVKRLASAGLVAHAPFGGVSLTEEGRTQALWVIRRHRLVETFLHSFLGFAPEELHDEAEVLEHAVSPRLAARMAEVLDNPTHDPHGDPIPPATGKHVEHDSTQVPLSSVASGSSVIIRRVPDWDSDALAWLAKLDLLPGTVVTIVRHDPYGGPVWVTHVTGQEVALGQPLAELVLVSDEVSGP